MTATEHPTAVTTKDSPRSFRDTVDRLVGLIDARQMRLFAVIDQAAEARNVGLGLRPTTLVVFGNPTAGTAVMDAAPLAAVDTDLAHNLSGIEALTDALVAP
ncbi:MAG: DUF302 domain-containing protein [Actinomycetota bacterium]|nr:DUF302 domain-containing protein [Actinomycetota bacterium]